MTIMSQINLNISGRHFEFDSDLLRDVESGARLKVLITEALDKGRKLSFTLNRSADSFAAVLAFYETGSLHLPTNVCPTLFLEELEFWGLSYEDLSECCYYRLHAFFDEMETRQNFKKNSWTLSQKFTSKASSATRSGFQRCRQKLWAIVDFQENTIWAKLYYILVITMVMLSILSLALSTEPILKRSLTKCELLEYLEYSDHPDYHNIREHFNITHCDGSDFEGGGSNDDLNELIEKGLDIDDDNGGKRKIVIEDLTVPTSPFSAFEIVFLVYFTTDIVLRLFSCPSVLKYFLYVLNVNDALALMTSYVLLLVENVHKEHQYEESWLHLLKYFQILRALRLLRVVKTFRASQVLAYSIRENVKDLLILGLFLFLALSTFSSLIYFAESRENIPSILVGWYWSIITLTTVGYGDIVPQTSAGRVIASVCAVLGVILMAVTVPIFVNNFLSLYNYAIVEDYVEKRRKRTAKSSPLPTAKHTCDLGGIVNKYDGDRKDKSSEMHIVNKVSANCERNETSSPKGWM